MSVKCVLSNIMAYSPALVLFVWAGTLANQDQRMSKEAITYFLVALGIATAIAETQRILKRNKKRREREQNSLNQVESR